MEAGQSKRPRAAILNTEKAMNLPLLCVETICKFTPTAKLTRLYSSAVPLPGAFWDFAVKSALQQKGFPFSLGDDSYQQAGIPAPSYLQFAAPPYHQAAAPAFHQAAGPGELFDAEGAHVTSVTQIKSWRFSPLREFVGSAVVHILAVSSRTASDKVELYIAQGEALLSHLPNLTELMLIVRPVRIAKGQEFTTDDVTRLSDPILKSLLPSLRSLTIIRNVDSGISWENQCHLDSALYDYVFDTALPELSGLERLDLPDAVFERLLQTAMSSSCIARLNVRRLLSGLHSLRIWQEPWDYSSGMLAFVTGCCSGQLSTLYVQVLGELRHFLAAFRALPRLALLGLRFRYIDLNGILFNESETITSVLDLRLVYSSVSDRDKVYLLASLFPNAKAVALQFGEKNRDPFDLASEFCAKRVLPALRTLRCHFLGSYSSCASERLAQFIASPDLPEAVDLSQIVFANLIRNARLLTDIYGAMQGNSVKLLLMRGPLHPEALSALRGHIELNGAGGAEKVTAWKDRDLGEQPGTANFPDVAAESEVKIVGVKTSGRLAGEQFTIRVVHQFAKREDI